MVVGVQRLFACALAWLCDTAGTRMVLCQMCRGAKSVTGKNNSAVAAGGVLQEDHASHELSQALWVGKVRGGDFCSTGLIYTKRGLSDE